MVASKLYKIRIDRYWTVIDLQVIHVHVEHLDGFELASLGVLKVQGRSPIVALVVLDPRRGASGLEGLIIGHGKSKGVPTLDCVDVGRGDPRTDNGVHSAHNKRTLAIEMIDGEGTLVGGVSRSCGGANGQKCCLCEVHVLADIKVRFEFS